MTQVGLKTVGYFQSLLTPVCQCFLSMMLICNAVSKKGPDSPFLPLLQTLIPEKSPIKPEGQHPVQITTQDARQH